MLLICYKLAYLLYKGSYSLIGASFRKHELHFPVTACLKNLVQKQSGFY